MPLPSAFLRKDQLGKPENKYPLDVLFCEDCGMVQLKEVVKPEYMFNEYAYFTGTSKPSVIHLHEMASHIVEKLALPENSLVVDIGSNDGTLLQGFKNEGMRVLGIDPAKNIAELANKNGIDTMDWYFNQQNVDAIISKKGLASVITGTNVFAHVDDLHDLVAAVSCLLRDNGVFIFEVPYLIKMLQNLEFDTIYHEHLSYISLTPLVKLFRKHDMSITDVEEQDVHGGTIRVYVEKGNREQSINVQKLLYIERRHRFTDARRYQVFADDVKGVRESLNIILYDLISQGKRIAGYGAAAKGNILTNYCQIGPDILEYIADTTSYKQGLCTPGMHIPVMSFDEYYKNPPDYTLLLAWNYAKQIMQKESGYKGKFIIPIPNPRIEGA
jgi:SAM-dependent methyltransferase